MTLAELDPTANERATAARERVKQYVLNKVLHLNPGCYENGEDEQETKNG